MGKSNIINIMFKLGKKKTRTEPSAPSADKIDDMLPSYSEIPNNNYKRWHVPPNPPPTPRSISPPQEQVEDEEEQYDINDMVCVDGVNVPVNIDNIGSIIASKKQKLLDEMVKLTNKTLEGYLMNTDYTGDIFAIKFTDSKFHLVKDDIKKHYIDKGFNAYYKILYTNRPKSGYKFIINMNKEHSKAHQKQFIDSVSQMSQTDKQLIKYTRIVSLVMFFIFLFGY